MYNIVCINLFKSNSLKIINCLSSIISIQKKTRKNLINKLSFDNPACIIMNASKQKTHFNFNNPLHFCPKSILFIHNAFPIDALSPPSSRAICKQVDTKTQIKKNPPRQNWGSVITGGHCQSNNVSWPCLFISLRILFRLRLHADKNTQCSEKGKFNDLNETAPIVWILKLLVYGWWRDARCLCICYPSSLCLWGPHHTHFPMRLFFGFIILDFCL